MEGIILTASGIWIGLFSKYLYSADKLPGYKPNFAKNVFTVPMGGLASTLIIAAYFLAFVSDSATLHVFNALQISNTGIADLNVQSASLVLTTVIGTLIAWSCRSILLGVNKVKEDEDPEKYFTWAGFLMAILSALLLTSGLFASYLP